MAERTTPSRLAEAVRNVRRPNARESDVLQLVRDACGLGGWLCYHTHDSRRSEGGFPDVVAVHLSMPRLVFAELKSAKGKLEPDQSVWLAALRATAAAPPGLTGYHVVRPEVYLWRPADADQIVEVLLGHRIHRDTEDVPYSSRDSSTREGG